MKRAINFLRWKVLFVLRHLSRLIGVRWNSYYAWMLDTQDRKVTLDQILSRSPGRRKTIGLWDWWLGADCVAFMKRHGLSPESTVVDFGCGYGRVMIPLLCQLGGGGKVIGIEISRRRLALAREWIDREQMADQSHELVLSKDNSLAYLANGTIDVFWVLSVFNHMPEPELEECLTAMYRVLRPNGRVFCYFILEKPNAHRDVKLFRRSEKDMRGRLESLGFATKVLADWAETVGDSGGEACMVLATKRATC
jgi:SAM-dependent methyltransferase